MKTYCLIFLIVLPSIKPVAAIRNGYAKHIVAYRLSLGGLHELLSTKQGLSAHEKRTLKNYIKSLETAISYYEVTEILLTQFRDIAQDLYNEIDTIRDRQGRITDVYVKLVPRAQIGVSAAGVTFIAQAPGDKHAHQSHYGRGSVSIEICIDHKSLLVLAHELGHVKHQVPNLHEYVRYHAMQYRPRQEVDYGHAHDDESGLSAMEFESKFRKMRRDYLLNHNRLQSPLRILLSRKNVRPNIIAAPNL